MTSPVTLVQSAWDIVAITAATGASWLIGWRISTMDPAAILNALAVVLTAGAAFIAACGAYRKLRADDKATDRRLDLWVKADIRRGFAEAENGGHLIRSEVEGRPTWIVSGQARIAFGPIIPELRMIAAGLTVKGKPPSDMVLIGAIMENWDAWIASKACPALKVVNYGCMAIASVLARETDSLRVSMMASPAHPNEPGKPS